MDKKGRGDGGDRRVPLAAGSCSNSIHCKWMEGLISVGRCERYLVIGGITCVNGRFHRRYFVFGGWITKDNVAAICIFNRAKYDGTILELISET